MSSPLLHVGRVMLAHRVSQSSCEFGRPPSCSEGLPAADASAASLGLPPGNVPAASFPPQPLVKETATRTVARIVVIRTFSPPLRRDHTTSRQLSSLAPLHGHSTTRAATRFCKATPR